MIMIVLDSGGERAAWIQGVKGHCDNQTHHKCRLRINQRPYCDILRLRINEKYDAQLLTEK